LRLYIALIVAFLLQIQTSFAEQDRYSSDYLAKFDDVSQQYSRSRILEVWGYNNSYGPANNYSDTLRLRYYQPVHFDDWKGTFRFDTSGTYVPNNSSQRSGKALQPGDTFITVWGNHPNFLANWGGNIGGRVILPFGNGSQLAIGPQFGMSFRPEKGTETILADFSPLVRYMYGFYQPSKASAANGITPTRDLQLYPTFGIKLGSQTQIRFWDENGIHYNTAQGTWFVPIDAMVTHRINPNLLVAIGASKQLVQTYAQYDWVAYGKVAVSF
jgi:hypothetical protein